MNIKPSFPRQISYFLQGIGVDISGGHLKLFDLGQIIYDGTANQPGSQNDDFLIHIYLPWCEITSEGFDLLEDVC